MSKDKFHHCCDMNRKVALQIAKIYTEEECGVSDIAMVDFHDFNYESKAGLPVNVALSLKFCPWCGERRPDDKDRRITEVIQRRPKS